MKKSQSDKQWDGKSRGGAFGYRFFVFLIRVFGIQSAYIFLTFVAIHFIPFAPKATYAIWQYNRKIQKYGVLQSIWKLFIHYYIFGQTIIDRVAINNGLVGKYHFEFENYDKFLKVLDSGSAVIISAHIGCWGIGTTHYGDYAKDMNVVMYDAEYEKIKTTLESQDSAYKVIPVNEGGIESLLRIKAALDAKQYVCFQGDRYVSKLSTTKQRFMQYDALFPIGPTLLASKFKQVTVIYFAMRERGKKYRFKFLVIDKPSTQQELMDAYITELEKTLKQYPQQWFNFYNFWA